MFRSSSVISQFTLAPSRTLIAIASLVAILATSIPGCGSSDAPQDAQVHAQGGYVYVPPAGGSGSSVTTPDGTTTVTRLPVFNPVDYGAAGTINQSTLAGTESSGSTVIDLTTGQGTQWRAGHSLVIPWAGSAHQWASVTPTIGGVIAGGSTTFTCSTSTDLFTVTTYQRSIITGTGVKIYATTSLPTVSGTPFTDGDTVYLRLGTHRNTFSVHPTALDATNNTNAYNFDGAGSGTLSLSPIGATTYPYRIAAMSGAGGMTVRSAAVQTTVGMATLSLNGFNTVWWDPVSDGSGNYCHGYCIWGRSDDHFLTAINAAPSAFKLTCQSGGYTNFVPTDLGKQLVTGGANRGQVVWYDNTTRVVILLLSQGGETTYPTSTAISVSGGEGAGTTTGSASMCYAWLDCGDVETDYDNRTWAWRTGREEQEIQISGTATGGTYVLAWGGYQTAAIAYNADATAVQAALRTIPGLEAITVSGSGTAPNITFTVVFREHGSLTRFGMGKVPKIVFLSSLTGGTPLWTVETTVIGASFNPGNLVLNPATSSGTWQECYSAVGGRGGGTSAPSFSSTLNTSIADCDSLIWIRSNTFYPVTSPSAALPDAYFGTVSSVSSNALTVTPATSATVSAGTPVMHNDLPAWQAAWAAALAVGGGRIECGGNHNWYTRLDAATEWAYTDAAGIKSLFGINDGTVQLSIDMCGATARWRPFQTNDFYTLGGTTVDDTVGQRMFLLRSWSSFELRSGSIVVAASGEPRADGPTAEGENFVFRCDNDTGHTGRVLVDNCRLIGFSGFGQPYPSASRRGSGSAKVRDSLIRYGGGGHDFCFTEIELLGCRVEGTNGRHRSTAVYTDPENMMPFKSYGTDFIEPGVDGLRIRNPNAEIIGGSITAVELFPGRTNSFTTAIYLEGASNARVSGVTFNTYGEGISVASSRCTFIGNTFRNCGIGTISGGTDVSIIGNSFVFTGWVRRTTSSGGSAIGLSQRGAAVSGNTVYCEQTHSSADTPELHGTTRGINITGGDDIVIGPNEVYSSQNAIEVTSGFTGKATFTGGKYTSYDLVHSSNNESCRLAAGNGAYVKFSGVHFDSVTKSDEVWVGGTSSAKYIFKDCTFDCELELDAALTTPVTVDGCDFNDATQSVDFSDAATIITDSDFAVAPTLTGALLQLMDNKVAGALSSTPAALGASTNNDVALPVTDQVRLDPNAANSIVTSFVACADGVEKTIICTDAGAATITIDSSAATGTAANKIMCPGDVDIVMSTGERIVIRYDATTSLWYVIGGQYVAMDWQGGERLWQQGEQIWNQPATRQWALAA